MQEHDRAIDSASVLIREMLIDVDEIEIKENPFSEVQQRLDDVVNELLKTHSHVGIMELEGEIASWLDSQKTSMNSELGLKVSYVLGRFFAERFSYPIRTGGPEGSSGVSGKGRQRF